MARISESAVSFRHDPSTGTPSVQPILSGDTSAPEFTVNATPECRWPGLSKYHDPFPTDVYYMGNLVRAYFMEGADFSTTPTKRGFEFLQPLIRDMVQEDPAKRPTMTQVVTQFAEITSKLSEWKLRSRLVRKNEWLIPSIIRNIRHWIRQYRNIQKGLPAIPY